MKITDKKKQTESRKKNSMPVVDDVNSAVLPPPKATRVLVEFPVSLLKEADETAIYLRLNRSQLIRSAVEQHVKQTMRKRFERELAEGYAANAQNSLDMLKEFEHVDSEGWDDQ